MSESTNARTGEPVTSNEMPRPGLANPSKAFARNTMYNFLGQTVPLGGAFLSISFVVHTYDAEYFGLISIAWLLLGYFTFLDFGLNRATIRGIAVAMQKGDSNSIQTIFWSSLIMNAGVGILACALMLLGTPYLVTRVFTISPALIPDAENLMYVMALSIPIVTTATVLRGALEAIHRFDIVNIVKIVSNTIIFCAPMLLLVSDIGIVGVVLVMVLGRVVSAAAYFFYARKHLSISLSAQLVTKSSAFFLLSFGGWITVTNILTPVLSYAERLVIASLLSVTMLAYYAAPYELVSRVAILPASVALTLFPMFGSFGKGSMVQLNRNIIVKPLKYLVIGVTPLTIFFVVFAGDILALWVGAEFAHAAKIPMQVLAVAFFFNSIAYIPLAATQGLGYPDLKAKIDLFLVLFFVSACVFLIPSYGLIGAAVSKLLLFLLDSTLLLYVLNRKIEYSKKELWRDLYPALGPVMFLTLSGFIIALVTECLLLKIALFGILLLTYGMITWRYSLTVADKEYFRREMHFIPRRLRA